jgi:hypothetical protein
VVTVKVSGWGMVKSWPNSVGQGSCRMTACDENVDQSCELWTTLSRMFFDWETVVDSCCEDFSCQVVI